MEETTFSTRLSLGLFTIGTLLLVVFAASLSTRVAMVGYLYAGLALLVSTTYLIVILIRVIRGKLGTITGLKAIGILMANMPVAIFYFYLVVSLLNTARITFENATGYDLTAIRIMGCDDRQINSIQNGESKTIWLNIPGDCSLEIEYQHDGELKKETVAGYLTNFNGVIATYRIGSGKEILF
jgi:hypothetical protein